MIKFAKRLLSFYNGECINKRTIINIRLYTHIYTRIYTYMHSLTHTYLYYIYTLYIKTNLCAKAPTTLFINRLRFTIHTHLDICVIFQMFKTDFQLYS